MKNQSIIQQHYEASEDYKYRIDYIDTLDDSEIEEALENETSHKDVASDPRYRLLYCLNDIEDGKNTDAYFIHVNHDQY